jgi:hypothetical protein
MRLTAFFLILVMGLLVQLACSKTGGIPPPPPPDPCSYVTINLTGVVSNPSVPGAKDGSITLTAGGGTGFMFSLNGGAFQASNLFNNLGPGNYSVMARSSAGCVGSLNLVVVNPTISCSSINIVVATNTTDNIPCENNTATLTATATGGTAPYQYSIDGGPFYASNSFGNLATGSHIVLAKDANGCTGSSSATVINQAAGPQFLQVKAVIQSRCLYCHSNANASGGVNYSVDCNIITNKLRIKARAVDGVPSPMPQSGLIPVAERQKILDWLNGGGTFSN